MKERLGIALIALVSTAAIFSVIFAVLGLHKIASLQRELEKTKSYLEKKISDLGDRIGRVEDLIGPNSPLDEYIRDVSYIKAILEDLKTFERIISEIPDEPTSGYFRVLVVGSEKVWFEVGKGKKKYFADELFPGLSPQRFYYFKAPNVDLDFIVPVPPDAYISVGKPGRVYLVFFGVGVPGKRPVKIVRLDKTYYPSIKTSFNLYIPK